MTSNVSRSGNSTPRSLINNTNIGPETFGRGSNTEPRSMLSGLPLRGTSAGSTNNQNGLIQNNTSANRSAFQRGTVSMPTIRLPSREESPTQQERHPDNILSDRYRSALQQSTATALQLPLERMSQLHPGPSQESSPSRETLHRDNRISDILAARSLTTESQNLPDSVQVTPNSSPPTSSRDRSWDVSDLRSPRDYGYGQE